ncbi:MAG: alpha-galactosidase, partial [Clostridia bacterium]|nr:alpha-galactosidase [Clostridia bacterium]
WDMSVVPELIVGNFTPKANILDGKSMIEISKLAEQRGLKMLVWYEPERATYGTDFYEIGQQHERWLIKHDYVNNMWNLADEDAYIYMRDALMQSFKDINVKILRIDFNFLPQWFWQQADKNFYDNRNGICENHYITNLYRMFDYFFENIDGFFIDNCASGGKRIDLEMQRRGVPLWSSDYFCASKDDECEAAQHTSFGGSFFMPIFGKGFFWGEEYETYSSLAPCWHDPYSGKYEELLDRTIYNYYPLTYGGAAQDNYCAYQYDIKAQEGEAFIFRRPNCSENKYLLKLNGLKADASYELYDFENPDERSVYTGAQLMYDGIEITLEKSPSAVALVYEQLS